MDENEKLDVSEETQLAASEPVESETNADGEHDEGQETDWARHAANIVFKNDLYLVGVRKHLDSSDGGDNYEKVLAFFDECEENGTLNKLRDMAGDGESCFYGACTNFTKKAYDYFITVKVDRAEDEKYDVPDGMEVLYAQAGDYAVFNAKGAMPTSLSDCWRDIYTVWFTKHEYAHLDKPEIEVHPFMDRRTDDYHAEVYVPVKLMPERKPPDRRGQMTLFFGMLLGLTVGAVIGSSLGNITVGIIVGAIGGSVLGTMLKKKRDDKEKDDR